MDVSSANTDIDMLSQKQKEVSGEHLWLILVEFSSTSF